MQKKDLLLLLLAIGLLFVGIFDHSLWTPDEPRVAEIARNMAATGDYLIPHLSGSPFLEQPPLYYAVTGLFWKALGTANEGFGRLSSVLFALGTLLVIFFGMRRLYDTGTAVPAVLIVSTTIGFFLYSHKMLVDNALAFFITGAMFSFILAYLGMLRAGYLFFWICLAGAFLTKGIIGLAIPGVGVVAFALWQRDFRLITRAWVVRGTLLVLAVMLAWGYILYQRGGTDFLFTFFLFNNLGRFMDVGVYQGGHVRPLCYYLQVIFTEGLPWSLLLIPATVFLRRPDTRLRFFYSWFFGGFILLSIASTKRGLYILPLYPAMAAVVGVWLSRMPEDVRPVERRWATWLPGAFTGLVFIMVPIAFHAKLGGSWQMTLLASLLSALFLGTMLGSRMFTLPQRLAACWALLLLTWSPVLFHQVDVIKSYRPFFRYAGTIVGNERVMGYNLSETALAFSSFYGGFRAESIPDWKRFEGMVNAGSTPYVLYFNGRDGSDVQKLLQSRGFRLIRTTGYDKRPTELWNIKDTSEPQGDKNE